MSEPVSVLDRAAAKPRPTLSLADRGPVGQVTLKGDLGDPDLGAAVEAVVGVGVPGTRQAAFADDTRGAVWMAPDELLLFTDYAAAGSVVAQLSEALAGRHHMALDVSDARVVIRLTGADVAETLAKGAPIDLSEAAFPPGSARRTHLSGVAVGIWRREAEVWEIVCLRSCARHLWDWLMASGVPGAAVGRF